MGSWRARRLNLFRDLQPKPRFETLSEIALPFVPMGTTFHAVRRDLVYVSSCSSRCGCTAPAELALIGPHTMQDNGEFTGDSNAGLCHAAPLRDVHAPCPKRRPFPGPGQQRMGRLVEPGAQK